MIQLIDDVSHLSNKDLMEYSKCLAHHENNIGLHLITCLREAEKRMLYLKLGLTSLWDYATQYLGLSKGNAQMKIDAMRLARDNPLAHEKLQSGELSIPNAAKVNSFFRHEKKAGHAYSPTEKSRVVESVLGVSQDKCERTLLALSPENIPAEKVRPLTETKTELKIVIDEKTMAVLQRLKELLSHKMPDATYAELLDYLARDKVDALERQQKPRSAKSPVSPHQEQNSDKETVASATPNTQQNSTPPTGVTAVQNSNTPESPRSSAKRQHISREDYRFILSRAGGRCEHEQNGQRCPSRYQIQIDHITPVALGGQNERSNYRALCRQHNIYYAKMHLGSAVMAKFIPGLKEGASQ